MKLPRLRVAVSIDGLPEHHDVRRKPGTYERILNNVEGREVNIHWDDNAADAVAPGIWKSTWRSGAGGLR